MKELSITRLGKIEAAHGRLERAIARLERAVVAREESAMSALSTAAMVERDLRTELETVKVGHIHLEATARSVADRLDDTIERLKALLGE